MEEKVLTNMTDAEIAWSMRKNNFEKFKTLVRMHLSFELDLNTDEFDLPNHEVVYFERGKMKKWNRLTRKIKSCSSKTTTTTSENSFVLDDNFIRHLKKLKLFILMEKNVVQEGIFRKAGSVTRQNELRDFVCNDKPFELTNGYTVHDCATVFKSFLADLQEPVLTDAHYPAHCQIAPLFHVGDNVSAVDKNKESHILNSMQLLLLLLPNENRILLQDIIEMLHTVSAFKDKNKMSSENLATLFAPHLICPRNLPPEALHYVAQTMFPIIAYMISKGSVIFQIPAKLSTDIRAYYHEINRKKIMSPNKTLDDSISDMSTVNTIYTFVDREKTAAAHNANNTDTELAQLYAHIQSLPESSKKRRLIKQFNKQNGQGTPLQLLIMNRRRRSETTRSTKSISDSIKKHIFHKGIVSRTPKRSGFSVSTHGTPIFSPKLRVLFRSPTLDVSSKHNSSTTKLSPSNLSTKTNTFQKSHSSSSLILTTSLCKKEDYISPTSFTSSNKLESFPFSKPQSTENIQDSKDLIIGINQNTAISKNQEFKYIRHKSEPNLSGIIDDKPDDTNTNINKTPKGKGLSMESLEVSFSSHSSGFKYFSVPPKSSYDFGNYEETDEPITEIPLSNKENCTENGLATEGDNTTSTFTCDYFEETPKNNHFESMSDRFFDINKGRLSLHRNHDLLTSTPSTILSRRSMSPITKSTQRMPKAMQESIMTPRSRKPVVLTNILGNSEQTSKRSESNIFLPDEDVFINEKRSDTTGIFKCARSLNNNKTYMENKSLSSGFRQYFLSRSLLTASPEDSSFSSQPDDFTSTQEIDDIKDSQFSPNLLRCLDGNFTCVETCANKTDDVINSTSHRSEQKGITPERDSCHVVEDEEAEQIDRYSLTKEFLRTKYNEHFGGTSL